VALAQPGIGEALGMLDYGQRVEEAVSAQSAPGRPLKFYLATITTSLGLFSRNRALILIIAATSALGAFGLSKMLTPRYVATAQIYIDPHGLPGVDKQGTPQGEDSNGFINFVESQSLIITSRIVLERVVASEKLDRDDEFVGGASLLWQLISRGSPGQRPTEDNVNAAVQALASRITIHRPERTFVIDLSVRSRDPEKAARLANAVAGAYIEAQSAMQSDAARQTTVSLSGKLEVLRTQLIAAERKVQDFKAQNGLVGTREQLVAEQQLKEMNQQITVARTRVEEARSHYEQIQAARARGGDVGAIAIELNLASLTPLRAQQAEARQKLADLSSELGPKHPQVKDAEARVKEANRAIDAELTRFADGVRHDYSRAKDLEASLDRQLDSLKQQTLANDQTSVGLRDLEREADAARNVYELFVTRSRQTGDIQQIDANAPNMKIISSAIAPKDRSFPPNVSLLTGAGFALGLALGFALAAVRERQSAGIGMTAAANELPTNEQVPKKLVETTVGQSRETSAPVPLTAARRSRSASAGPVLITITPRTVLERREREQAIGRIDLTALGFATLQRGSDHAEFRGVFDAYRLFEQLREPDAVRRIALVAGPNDLGLRTTLAINLALTAAANGLRVALVDAASRNSKLTRAVRSATRSPSLTGRIFFDTVNKVLLALPKGYDETRGRMRPADVLQYLRTTTDEAVDLIICDGPDVAEIEAAGILNLVDDIIAIEERHPAVGGRPMPPRSDAGNAKLRAIVRLDDSTEIERKRRQG
jgi:uncharacterized protein involved in exopolysaccharide biosynthesis/Mrp family chromosome partitioning ATPase